MFDKYEILLLEFLLYLQCIFECQFSQCDIVGFYLEGYL